MSQYHDVTADCMTTWVLSHMKMTINLKEYWAMDLMTKFLTEHGYC